MLAPLCENEMIKFLNQKCYQRLLVNESTRVKKGQHVDSIRVNGRSPACWPAASKPIQLLAVLLGSLCHF